jgi:hypothetical protein
MGKSVGFKNQVGNQYQKKVCDAWSQKKVQNVYWYRGV